MDRNGHVQVWDIDQTEMVKEYTGMEGTPRGLGVVRNKELLLFVSRYDVV